MLLLTAALLASNVRSLPTTPTLRGLPHGRKKHIGIFLDRLEASMRGVVRAIEANDIVDWPNWEPAHPSDELQWFTVSVGLPDEEATDAFQVAVATPQALAEQRPKTPFVGIIVAEWIPAVVEEAIRAFVASVAADTWQDIAAQLEPTMRWEFSDYCR